MIFAEVGRELPIQATLRPDDHFRAQTLEDRYSRDNDFGFAETLYQRLDQSHALVRLIGSGVKSEREPPVMGHREGLITELLLQFQQVFASRLIALRIEIPDARRDF
jgi:hypothetical protein